LAGDPSMCRRPKVVFLERGQGRLLAPPGRRCRPSDRRRWVEPCHRRRRL